MPAKFSGRAALFAALIATACSAPATASAETWSSPVQVSTDGTLPYSPTVVAADDGSMTAVWFDNVEGGDKYVTASTRLPGETTWSAPQRISDEALTSGDDGTSIAATADGTVAVLWASEATGQQLAAVRTAGSSDFGPETALSSGTASTRTDIVARPDGSFVAAWSEGSPQATYSRIYDGSWQPAQVVQPGDVASTNAIALSVDDAGDTTIAYARRDGSSNPTTIFSRRLTANASAWSDAETVETFPYGSGLMEIISAPNGEVTVAYDVDETSGDGPDMTHTATRGTEGTWASPVALTGPGTTSWMTNLVSDAAGNLTALMMGSHPDSGGVPFAEHVATRAVGGSWSASSLLSTPGTVGADGDGFYAVNGVTRTVWLQSTDMTTASAHYATKTAFADPFSTPVELVSGVPIEGGLPISDANRFGDMALVWVDAGGDLLVRELVADRSEEPPADDPDPAAEQPPATDTPAPTKPNKSAPKPTTLAPLPEAVIVGKRIKINAKVTLRKRQRCSGRVTASAKVGKRAYRTQLKLATGKHAGKRACLAAGTITLRKAPTERAKIKLTIAGKQITKRSLTARHS